MNVRDTLNVIIKLVETKDELTKTQGGLIKKLEQIRAGVRVSLIAMRTAVKKGGSVSEEQLKDLIDELKAK